MIHTNSSSVKGKVTRYQRKKKVWKPLQIFPWRFCTQGLPTVKMRCLLQGIWKDFYVTDSSSSLLAAGSLSSLTLARNFCLCSSGFYYVFCGEEKGCSGAWRSLISHFPNSSFLLQFSTGSNVKHWTFDTHVTEPDSLHTAHRLWRRW